jgi:hypothetical protein
VVTPAAAANKLLYPAISGAPGMADDLRAIILALHFRGPMTGMELWQALLPPPPSGDQRCHPGRMWAKRRAEFGEAVAAAAALGLIDRDHARRKWRSP